MKKPPPFPRCEQFDLWLTLQVVQFSDSHWTAAPHLSHAPDQTNRPERTDTARPFAPPKDDIVGWPDELLIDFPDSQVLIPSMIRN